MKRNKAVAILIGAVAVLAIAMGAKAAVADDHSNAAPETVPLRATWAYQPQSFAEARNASEDIVLAEVVSVTAGPDIVTPQPGEPEGVSRIPTQRITVRLLTVYKGVVSSGQQVVLFQTGGVSSDKPNLRYEMVDDPAYQRGEQYFLMLVPGPDGTMRTIAPEGRYRFDRATGHLTPMVDGTVAAEVSGMSLSEWEPTLKAQN